VNQPPVIHIVDDDEAYRTAVARLLEAKGYTTRLYPSAEDFLEAAPGPYGCVLLDVRMPQMSGLEAQGNLNRSHFTLPIIFVSGHGDIPTSVIAIKSGAEDFLTKPVSGAELFPAIERALQRCLANQSDSARTLEWHTRFARLTPREVEVFELMVAGKLTKQIAAELGATERTIKAHRHQIMEKMGARTLGELINSARQRPMPP
jgi:FixJ family two-component response regulator